MQTPLNFLIITLHPSLQIPIIMSKLTLFSLSTFSNVSNRYVESPASSSVRVRVRALTSPVAVNTFIKTFNKAFVVTSEAPSKRIDALRGDNGRESAKWGWFGWVVLNLGR